MHSKDVNKKDIQKCVYYLSSKRPRYSSGVEEHKKTIQTQVVTITQTLVDGKVVSESKDVAPGGHEVCP